MIKGFWPKRVQSGAALRSVDQDMRDLTCVGLGMQEWFMTAGRLLLHSCMVGIFSQGVYITGVQSQWQCKGQPDFQEHCSCW